MIFNHNTERSIEILKQKRASFLAEEKRMAACLPAAIVKRFRLMELDRACADDPGGSVHCCSADPHRVNGAFMAFPNDTAKMVLCCVDCGTIHYVGEDE